MTKFSVSNDKFFPKNISSPTKGYRLTRKLFLEESKDDLTYVLYTLKSEDTQGYPSLHRLYLEERDPTEYQFSMKYLDGPSHLLQLEQLSWFKPYITRWRQELDSKLRAEALANIIHVANDKTHKSNYEANKYLLSAGWKTKEEKTKVGRPSKDEIRRQAEELFSLDKETKEEYDRVMNKDLN